MKTALLSGALCLALGLGLGRLLAGPAPAPIVHEVEAGTAPPALTRAELAAVVREELARERAAGLRVEATGTALAAPAHDPQAVRESLTAELADQADRATHVVGGALARGRWTEADKAELGAQLDGLPGAVKAEITAQLADAVNRGVLQLDVDGFPI